MQETLSFEAMPQAILELMHKVDTLRADISELKKLGRTQTRGPMLGIDEACKILQRAKSTVYALAQAHKIPFYQPGKMLQFKRSELMAWMDSSRQETSAQTRDSIIGDMQRGIRHKPKSNWGMQ